MGDLGRGAKRGLGKGGRPQGASAERKAQGNAQKPELLPRCDETQRRSPSSRSSSTGASARTSTTWRSSPSCPLE
eukprot:2731653-Pyramimonas_sp.AAC.1